MPLKGSEGLGLAGTWPILQAATSCPRWDSHNGSLVFSLKDI